MILCTGCSWTYGSGLNPDQTYPAYLQKFLKTKTINAGAPGTDVSYSIWNTLKLVKQYNIQQVFLQLTTLDRLTIPVTGKQNFLENCYYKNTEDEIYFNDDNDFTRVNGRKKFSFDLLTVASYLESIGKKQERNYAFKFLNENAVFSEYKQDHISMQLFMLYQYLKSKNINLYVFPWLNWPNEFKYSLFGEELSKIVHSYSVQEFIEDHNLTDQYIDNGFHVSEYANKRIVNEYIAKILEII